MGDLEKPGKPSAVDHQAIEAKRKQQEREEAQKDSEAPEWHPRPNTDYQRVQVTVSATQMRGEPLRYGSLAGKEYQMPGGIAAMKPWLASVWSVRYSDARGMPVSPASARTSTPSGESNSACRIAMPRSSAGIAEGVDEPARAPPVARRRGPSSPRLVYFPICKTLSHP